MIYIYCKDWGLKECPMCGCNALKVGDLMVRGFFIACDCGLDFRRFEGKKEAIKQWNARKPR